MADLVRGGVDREQVRRDAERHNHPQSAANGHLLPEARLARHCLALLAELEQAERERDELGPLFVRDCCRILGVDENDTLRMDKIAARLAKVPALVEALRLADRALRRHAEWCGYNADAPGDGSFNDAERALAAAFAEWESG